MTADPGWLARHVRLLRASYQRLTGRHLLLPELDDTQAVAALQAAEFAVVSHGTESDPVFNYANVRALQLFEMSWEEFTSLPSRFSAEPLRREERARLLERVTRHGYIDDYSGVRISSSGRRFHIKNATIWNVQDEAGLAYGQAALITRWHFLENRDAAAIDPAK